MDEIGYMILTFVMGALIGIVLGQLSVWRRLRKKRTIKICDWEYSAIPITELKKMGKEE